MNFTHAITRAPGENFADGITTATLGVPDFELISLQHRDYVQRLRDYALEVVTLPALGDCPDAYFVEDPALVFPELAVITRPGAAARQGERESLAEALLAYRPLARIEAPATLDGGDVLVLGRDVHVGLSERTNASGAEALAAILKPHGYRVITMAVTGGLHLKSCVSQAADDLLLVTAEFAHDPAFQPWRRITLPDEEAYACNVLFINGHLTIPAGFPRVRALLGEAGVDDIDELDVSEARKMDGGLTCMSLRF